MSDMNEIIKKNSDFINLYNKSYRLTAAVFTISNLIIEDEELRTKIKKLSLELVSSSVNLKDINFLDAKKLITDIEKNALLLISLLDVASVTGLISAMNGSIIKAEFQSFILELAKFAEKFEDNKNVSVKGIFTESVNIKIGENFIHNFNKLETGENFRSSGFSNEQKNIIENGNGHKRKDLRKSTILDFIKGHDDVNIKDIIPNIIGCSEKTVQRELIELINEGKIKKIGERRWSRYSII